MRARAIPSRSNFSAISPLPRQPAHHRRTPTSTRGPERNTPIVLKTWETLVNIDSGTGFAAGLTRAEELLADSLRNWTVIRGRERRNIIPDQARAEADMRFSDWSETARVRRQAEEIIRNKHFEASTLELHVVERRPPLSPNPASDALAAIYQTLAREVGLEVTVGRMRFGTDAGFAYQPDSSRPAVLETLGVVGGRIHTQEEFAEIDSVIPRLYLTVRMVQACATRSAAAPE